MIYLFDDKVQRQRDARWSKERFQQFSDIIQPISRYNQIEEETKRREIFSVGNIVLFHESFFDNVLNKHSQDGIEIRNKLNAFASQNNDFHLAFFSGSINTRTLSRNVAYLPVSILYQNLEVFSTNARTGEINLRYLLFGANHEVEEVLWNSLNNANKIIDEDLLTARPTSHNFIAVAQMGEIEIPLENADSETFFTNEVNEKYDNDIDKYSTELITKWFSSKDYDNIFIPICFGATLSDFNGLRFATHIRCSNTPNRLKNIFLYSFVGYEYLIKNEYFNILKTSNVFLIEHNKSAFFKAANSSTKTLAIEDLPTELAKLKLDVPGNYFDNHHVANEWGIFQMARNAGIEISEIEGSDKSKFDKLYFKWLVAKNSLEESIPDDQQEEQKQYAERLPGLIVLGKIDLIKSGKK